MRELNEIIIHCSATPEGKNYTIEDIDKWHKDRGFNEIGYHYVIYIDGSIHKGRDIEKVGAHCTNHNANSIGICYIGGLAKDGKTPKDTRTDNQKNSLYSLVKELKSKYNIMAVSPHSKYANKACPCFNVDEELKKGLL